LGEHGGKANRNGQVIESELTLQTGPVQMLGLVKNMNRRKQLILRVAMLAAVFGPAQVFEARSQSLTYQCSKLLRSRVERMESALTATVCDETLQSQSRLVSFYEPRIFWPAWSEEGLPLAQADSLIEALRNAEGEGLSPAEFHLGALQSLLDDARREGNRQSASDVSRLVDLDLLLTDALLTYGTQLLFGKTQPPEALKEGLMDFRAMDFVAQAERAVRVNRLSAFLQQLVPVQPGYRNLREALARYRRISEMGGWLPIKPDSALRRTGVGAQVKVLRERLGFECDTCHDFRSQRDTFDLDVEQAVKEFQRSHGLPASGVVDVATCAALNVPVGDRIRQLEVNLERLRWLPRTPPDRCIVVNIAGFSLRVLEHNRTLMAMKVIAGKDYKPTPILASEITHLILNPSWNVPREIGQEEIFPAVKKDSSYLARRHFKVYSTAGRGNREVDPAAIDWTTADSTAYWFQQQPGPRNALGRMKFVFRNEFDVYIHDTPARALFKKAVRQFSHGCIRIERPVQLAEYVLRGNAGWTRKKLDSAMETHTERTVRLREAIPVYILYLTAWADESGPVQFRNDVYRLDEPHYRALGSIVQVKATLPEE
jgi:murein L,D-transpeptidase YcbB/YkuD